MTFQSLTGPPVQVCAQLTPGKLTSLPVQELRDVGSAQDNEADEDLLKYRAVSNKLVHHRRHCPRHGAAMFPLSARQVRLYV